MTEKFLEDKYVEVSIQKNVILRSKVNRGRKSLLKVFKNLVFWNIIGLPHHFESLIDFPE